MVSVELFAVVYLLAFFTAHALRGTDWRDL